MLALASRPFACLVLLLHKIFDNAIQSFSAKGHPYDNAVMECFFKYLKKEETNRRSYSSLDELKISIFKYIFGFYNSTRPHSNNGGLSPDDFENLLLFL